MCDLATGEKIGEVDHASSADTAMTRRPHVLTDIDIAVVAGMLRVSVCFDGHHIYERVPLEWARARATAHPGRADVFWGEVGNEVFVSAGALEVYDESGERSLHPVTPVDFDAFIEHVRNVLGQVATD